MQVFVTISTGQEGRLKEEMATSGENTCTNCGYVNGWVILIIGEGVS